MGTKAGSTGAAGLLSCSLCQDICKGPVTIPCGHSFCMGCIGAHWNTLTGVQKSVSCPLCIETFKKRHQLRENHLLSELVERSQIGGKQAATPEPASSPEDILCDFCTEDQTMAVLSCMACLGSYCEPHLKQHLEIPISQRHQLVSPVWYMEEKLCKVHLKPLEGFCRTDQTCICQMCAAQTHKEHEVVTLDLEREQIEGKHPELLKEVEKKTKEICTSIAQSREAMQLIKSSSLKEKEDGLRVLEKFQMVLVSSIESEERSLLTQAEEVHTGLEEKLGKLSLQRQKLEEVPSTDPAAFIRIFQALNAMADDPVSPTLSDAKPQSFRVQREAVHTMNDLMVNLERNQVGQAGAHVCLEEFTMDSDGKLTVDNSVPKLCDGPQRSTNMEMPIYFLEYAHQVVFDADTAERFLVLAGNEVKRQSTAKDYPENDRRFTNCALVLGQGLEPEGRYYWEVEILNGCVSLGLANQYLEPKGSYEASRLGRNRYSWCLRWDGEDLSALYCGDVTELQLSYKKIGVFLDFTTSPYSLAFVGVEPKRIQWLHQFRIEKPLQSGLHYPAFYLESVDACLKISPLAQGKHSTGSRQKGDTQCAYTSANVRCTERRTTTHYE